MGLSHCKKPIKGIFLKNSGGQHRNSDKQGKPFRGAEWFKTEFPAQSFPGATCRSWSLRKYPGMSRIPRHSSAPPTAVRKKLLMAPHLLQGLCHSSNCIPKEWGYHIPEERAGYSQQLPRAGNNRGGTRAQERNIPVDTQGSLLQGSLHPSPSDFRFLGEGTQFLWRLQDKNIPQKKKKN